MPNTIYKKRLRVRKNVDSPWIDIPAVVSTPGVIDPVDKTSAMTQPVGKDADGKLWTQGLSVRYESRTGDLIVVGNTQFDPDTGNLEIG